MARTLRPSRETVATFAVIVLLIGGLFVRSYRNVRGETGAVIDAPKLSDALSVSNKLETGTLRNGMRYFVQANTAPKHRAELRLVVNAGSVLETDNQRGLAHAVEHMVFRGTTHFPHRAIDKYTESIGMRGGQDINAHTGTDETTYEISVPTDQSGALDTAIAILADMAHEATFDPIEAKTEGGIVFEEWRQDRAAQRRLAIQRNALLLANSPYEGHEIIGDTSVLRKFDVNEMRLFYNAWYRPELMAIVVVGDFDPIVVNKLVRKSFGAIPSSVERKSLPAISVPIVSQARAAILTDDEATRTRVALWFTHRPAILKTVGDYRQWMVDVLFHQVLEGRLHDAADKPGSDLLSASISSQNSVRSLEATILSAWITDASPVNAVDELVGEVTRLAKNGPSEREFKQRTDAYLRERYNALQYSDWSSDLAAEYVNQFLMGDVVMPRQAQYNLARSLADGITAADLKRAAARVNVDSGVLIVVSGPANRAPVGVSTEKLVAEARAAAMRPVSNDSAAFDSVTLVVNTPPAGSVAREEHILKTLAVDWTLSNGMRVILKPSDFSDDNIDYRLFGTGGASLASKEDFASAYLSDQVVANSGIGNVGGAALDRLLDGSSISLTPYVSDAAISFDGTLAPRDLETLFKLLHLEFTAPRSDTLTFRRFLERSLWSRMNRSANPSDVFEDSISVITAQHHPQSLRLGPSFINTVTLPKAISFWKSRLANASGFTLVMTGDFTLEHIRPLVTRYLASLPAGVREQPRDNGERFPTGIVQREIRFGAGPRARTQIMFSAPIDYTMEASESLEAVRDLTDFALSEKLRETLGGTYGVDVTYEVSQIAPVRYRFNISFEAAPERIDSLATATIAELERLSTAGPTKEEFEKTRAVELRYRKDQGEHNLYWAGELASHATWGWPIDSISVHSQHIEKFTQQGMREACAKYLTPRQYTRVTMFPKTAAIH